MNANKKVEILLVEDNEYDAELTIRALKKKNLANNLVHLKDGAEAIDFLFGKQNSFDIPKVVLLDLKMPKVDGAEVLTRIRGDERTKNTPVVILTSSKEDPDIERCYSLGANSYIVKPVEFENFLDAVSNLGLYWMLINVAPRS